MTYLTHSCAFMFGFSLALLLVLRVSIRPKARRVLKQAGLVKQYKARVPNEGGFVLYDEEI